MMINILLAVNGAGDLWFALPLIVAVSFVYSATRYEPTELILRHAARTAVWMIGFMAIVAAVLWVINYFCG